MPTKSKTKAKAKATKGSLSKKQLAHLEKRLHEERARVMKELGYYDESFNSSLQASDGDLSSYSFHMADQGTDAMEREKAFLFASQEGRYLWHVNQALRRLFQAPEKFGKCEQCGEEIGFERIVALLVLRSMVISARPGDRFRLLALALVCAGAVGNVVDRIRSAQGVVDFVDVGIGSTRWPTFNVADSAITVGAIALAISLWLEGRAQERAKEAGAAQH